jgi:hypothetical protein
MRAELTGQLNGLSVIRAFNKVPDFERQIQISIDGQNVSAAVVHSADEIGIHLAACKISHIVSAALPYFTDHAAVHARLADHSSLHRDLPHAICRFHRPENLGKADIHRLSPFTAPSGGPPSTP